MWMYSSTPGGQLLLVSLTLMMQKSHLAASESAGQLSRQRGGNQEEQPSSRGEASRQVQNLKTKGIPVVPPDQLTPQQRGFYTGGNRTLGLTGLHCSRNGICLFSTALLPYTNETDAPPSVASYADV
ncbi:hypothetical protein OJAV_G00091600 [Oryzias javanicus]|uniref:Uncharacterized protein n=1 Tax=Oryzias javanicus TaxID=123683 RepID=A0A3S2MWG4_ORYJA|nr:hypothetical protein OJAV_G00091600 [Oryzias javanicus]